jgi:hypothetical protein
MMINLKAEPLNEESDPDLYLACPGTFKTEDEMLDNLDEYRHTWFAHTSGAVCIKIGSNDKHL